MTGTPSSCALANLDPGSLNGVDVQIDSYVFRILVRGTDGLDHKYFGHVNLIK